MQHIDGEEISIAIDLDQGARIASIQWRDLEIGVPFRGSPLSWGWYAMVPWAGRIRDGIIASAQGERFMLPTQFDPPNAIHGFGFVNSWEDIGTGRARLRLPFPYNGAVVEQRIELLGDALRWSLEYEAHGCDLPAWLGLHPWFARDLDRGESAIVDFRAQSMLVRDGDGIATSEMISAPKPPWDDAFTGLIGLPTVTWPGALRVTIESDAPWWVVYTQDQEGVCVEPQTAPPNANNLGISGEHYIEALFTFEADDEY